LELADGAFTRGAEVAEERSDRVDGGPEGEGVGAVENRGGFGIDLAAEREQGREGLTEVRG
jgi:hypothetical protein